MALSAPLRLASTSSRFPRFLWTARGMSTGSAAPFVLKAANVPADAAFIDASWHMPNSPRKAHQEFLKKRLPKARFLDLDEVASPSELGLKHMMPEPKVFAEYCG